MELIGMIVAIGVLAAISKIIILLRFGVLRKLMAFHGLIDLAAGAVFASLFFGTLTGMAIAMVAGLTFSLFVTLYRRFYGYDCLTLRGWRPAFVRTRGHV
jgi:hypothetical protein